MRKIQVTKSHCLQDGLLCVVHWYFVFLWHSICKSPSHICVCSLFPIFVLCTLEGARITESHSTYAVVWMTKESWEEEDVFALQGVKCFSLNGTYTTSGAHQASFSVGNGAHFVIKTGTWSWLLTYICFQASEYTSTFLCDIIVMVKITGTVLPLLSVWGFLHCSVLSYDFSSMHIHCSLHCFVYCIFLWLVSPPWQLQLPLLCPHVSGPLLSTCTVCAVFCISSFTFLSTSSLVQGSFFFDIFSFEAVEVTPYPCVALCISSFCYYLVSFLADSLLPSCKKGPDIHSFGKWFKNRRTDKLWKTADDSQGSPFTYQHVLVTLRSADNVRPWWETYIFISLCGLTAAANWVMPTFYCMHDRWTTPFKCHGGTESADNG